LREQAEAIRLDGLSVRILREVDLTVGRGEMVAIVGPSGAGKTTLLSVVGGLLRPESGRAEVFGQDLGSLGESELDRFRRERVAWLFQAAGLLPPLTALQNAAVAARVREMDPKDSSRAASAALAMVGLAERSHHLPSQLSGGEQQRVSLARALAKQVPMLLADEPTGHLDSESGEEVGRLLRSAADGGTTVVAVTHDTALASRADRILQLEDGRLS
jgi:ABC-type lipoprotein export system ATPase subunit